MPLSWNEIKHRAIKFGNSWKDESREAAERQTFWNEFFDVFGIKRRTVASFEEPVKRLSGAWGAIDIFWPGKLLAEHKSAGEDLDKAHAQGMAYIRGLHDSGRSTEIPRYLIVSDFKRMAIHDLEAAAIPPQLLFPATDYINKPDAPEGPFSLVFPITEFHKHIRHFAFVAGYKQHKLDPEDPANIQAAELMAELHDALHDGGFTGHDLRVFLVRILFCLFADDTGIFPPDAFKLFLTDRTAEDGSDLGTKIDRLFRILNTPEDKRQANLEEDLRAFPYVNGQLFEEKLEFADFNTAMRAALIKGANFRWERISPAVFGSLFQGVMDQGERRQLGAHYTAEHNILKLVRSLFLDDYRAEFEKSRAIKVPKVKRDQLTQLQQRLAKLRFFDPACGCGNFLVITYRELRRLELDILKELHGTQTEFTLDDVNKLSLIDVDQMYGIEIEEFPARIAEVALWLADHQANQELSQAFSQFYLRIPLRKSPHIHVANALRADWKTVLPPEECSYVLGNPPFVGKKEQTPEQKRDLDSVWNGTKNAGTLDFVTCWYRLAADYIKGTQVRVAFVSTNSICQGEQVSILWTAMLQDFGVTIQFAHTTFAWESEARGKAHVHCVIIGFGLTQVLPKTIYDYESDPVVPTATQVKNISPYLIEGSDLVIPTREEKLSSVAPEMMKGSEVTDKGHLLLSTEERVEILTETPELEPYIRQFTGGKEFLNGLTRWCLWLLDAPPQLIRRSPLTVARLEAVREFRLKSPKQRTVDLANFPGQFGENRQPSSQYLLFPKVSSERRQYLPIGFLDPKIIVSGSALVVPNATLEHFGMLQSRMHSAWMRQVCGRMKSDYQYSVGIVYNNYPWPDTATEAQRSAVEKAAQTVLDVRAKFMGWTHDFAPDHPYHAVVDAALADGAPPPPYPIDPTMATLADLYDPTTMPPALTKAHADLDRAVDRCYRKEPFPNDRARVEHLFALYETLTAPLAPTAKKTTRKKTTTL